MRSGHVHPAHVTVEFLYHLLVVVAHVVGVVLVSISLTYVIVLAGQRLDQLEQLMRPLCA